MKKILLIPSFLILGACSLPNPDLGGEAKYPDHFERANRENSRDLYANEESNSIFGENGLTLFGGDSDKQGGGPGIGVNSYLWRATLDTVSFLPLTSADPFGGVILSDWYSAPETPKERFKLNVFILGRELRADGVKVSVFRQIKKGEVWEDAPVAENTARNIEDSILTRAREIRISQLERDN